MRVHIWREEGEEERAVRRFPARWPGWPCLLYTSKQDWTTKQAALNFGWVLPVFVQLRVENQLIFVEKLYFRAITSGYRIETRAILVIKCVYTLTVGRQGKE